MVFTAKDSSGRKAKIIFSIKPIAASRAMRHAGKRRWLLNPGGRKAPATDFIYSDRLYFVASNYDFLNYKPSKPS
jgi:hypothetical protein